MKVATMGWLSVMLIGVAACEQKPASGTASSARDSATPVSSAATGDVAVGDLTAAERGLFAALPARIPSSTNEMTPAKVALGRQLYNEPVLSSGHDVSCASCHPLNGYGADGRRVSFGDVGHSGSRNSPTVYNAAGHVAQFWDGRAPTVEEQAKGPVLNPAEMAMPNADAVLAHMRGSAMYRAAFRDAFPSERDPINYDNVGRAIAAFERGLVTPSRWDRYLTGDSAALSADERRGAATFVRVGCANCHSGTYVGGSMYQKAGLLKPWPSQADSGRFKVTGKPADLMVFKVPSLRNVEKTSPYFHDGSTNDLAEAVRLMGRHQLGRELSDAQVQSIVTWLRSLTGEIPARYIAFPQLPPVGS